MKKKRLILLCIGFLWGAFTLTACEKAPESSEKGGVLVSETTNESEADNSGNLSAEEALQSLPTHLKKDFKNGSNCLSVDADICVPESDFNLYQAEVVMEAWSEEELEALKEELLAEGLADENCVFESNDLTPEIPLISLSYANTELIGEDKAGNLDYMTTDLYKAYLEKFCRVFEKFGFQLEASDRNGNAFSLTHMFEGIPFAGGFSTTGSDRNVNEYIGGAVSFADGQIVDFYLNGKYTYQDRSEVAELVDFKRIEEVLQRAVDTSEIIFSEHMKAVKLSLEYLFVKDGETIRMVPVWNVTFDLSGYYNAIVEKQVEEQGIGMTSLCISAVDGSVVYAA